MRQMLLDVQARLRSQITYVEDAAIHILIHPDMLPRHTQLPAIGIKDGVVNYEYSDQGRRRRVISLLVQINAYVTIPRSDSTDSPILGSGTLKGVLEIVDNINTALTNWKLGTDRSFFISRALNEEPSVPVGEEERPETGIIVRPWVQRKAINFEFARQEWI